jgi:serine/threonine protein kinase
MGEVYCACDTRLDRIVAIKVLPTHLADRSELRERFEREARTVASLNHPHICSYPRLNSECDGHSVAA